MVELTGFFAATYTPLLPNGDLNVDGVEPYYHYLKSRGIKGAFINGTTGDFTSLMTEERNLLAKAWIEIVDPDFQTIIHVGHTSLRECQHMAQHASEQGADVISAVPPFYFKPETVQALIDFCSEIARVNPDLPFLYYHIPQLTGAEFSMVEFLAQAKEQIPNLMGVKFSKPDLVDFKLALDYDPSHFQVLFGVDEVMLSSLSLGARGWVGSTYNHIPALYRKMLSHFASGEMSAAAALQHQSMEFVKIVASYGWSGASKYVMELVGIDCGPARHPHHNLSDREKSALRSKLDQLGFFQLVEEK